MVGAAPTLDTSSNIKGSVANKFGHSVPRAQTYWPRVSKQFDNATGLSASLSDNFPEWLSFRSEKQCEIAVDAKSGQFQLDFEGVAASLGVSVKIVSQIVRRPERHYRTFPIPKKSGGTRPISSPRVFLRVIQWFLSDFILASLPVHSSVHSFAIGRSVSTNAALHVQQAYVGSIDVKDFFGSISRDMVHKLLRDNGFSDDEATLIAALSTLNDGLPQGAPTSTILSNAFLYEFDRVLEDYCSREGLRYSRYADDITVSGHDRAAVRIALDKAVANLSKCSLRINPEKTRIVSARAQQVVTGVVVNEVAQPSRKYRRNIRAKFHNAAKQERSEHGEAQVLAGHLAYLRAFPSLENSKQMAALERDLRTVRGRRES